MRAEDAEVARAEGPATVAVRRRVLPVVSGLNKERGSSSLWQLRAPGDVYYSSTSLMGRAGTAAA